MLYYGQVLKLSETDGQLFGERNATRTTLGARV